MSRISIPSPEKKIDFFKHTTEDGNRRRAGKKCCDIPMFRAKKQVARGDWLPEGGIRKRVCSPLFKMISINIEEIMKVFYTN